MVCILRAWVEWREESEESAGESRPDNLTDTVVRVTQELAGLRADKTIFVLMLKVGHAEDPYLSPFMSSPNCL